MGCKLIKAQHEIVNINSDNQNDVYNVNKFPTCKDIMCEATLIIYGYIRQQEIAMKITIPSVLNNLLLRFYCDMFQFDRHTAYPNIVFLNDHKITKTKSNCNSKCQYQTCLFGPKLIGKIMKKLIVTFNVHQTGFVRNGFCVGYMCIPHKACIPSIFGMFDPNNNIDSRSVGYVYCNPGNVYQETGILETYVGKFLAHDEYVPRSELGKRDKSKDKEEWTQSVVLSFNFEDNIFTVSGDCMETHASQIIGDTIVIGWNVIWPNQIVELADVVKIWYIPQNKLSVQG